MKPRIPFCFCMSADLMMATLQKCVMTCRLRAPLTSYSMSVLWAEQTSVFSLATASSLAAGLMSALCHTLSLYVEQQGDTVPGWVFGRPARPHMLCGYHVPNSSAISTLRTLYFTARGSEPVLHFNIMGIIFAKVACPAKRIPAKELSLNHFTNNKTLRVLVTHFTIYRNVIFLWHRGQFFTFISDIVRGKQGKTSNVCSFD